MTDLGFIVGILAFGLATVSYFKANYKTKDMAELTVRLVALETKMDLFWSIVESQMAKVLHSPHTPDLDRLLEKIDEGQVLDSAELDELTTRLKDIILDPETRKEDRIGATLMLAALEARYKDRTYDTDC